MVTRADLDRAFRPTNTLIPMPAAAGVTGGGRQTQTSTATTATTDTQMPRPPRRQLSPTATNTGQSANARVNRALSIRQGMGGVQGSRQSAERAVNDDLAESLRLNLIEQQRLRANARAPGRMNPVQFRAMRAEMDANQNAVNAGVEAINQIRGAEVTRAGQLTDAETTLQDRAMSEAGAFDRAALNLDTAEIQGRFGLLKQGMANEGAVAAQEAVNPLQAFALENLRTQRRQFAEQGTPEEQARLASGLVNASLGLAALPDPTAGTAPVEMEITGPDGLPQTVLVDPETATRVGQYRAYVANPGAFGMTPEDVNRYADQLLAGTITPEDIAAQKQQQTRQRQVVPSRVRSDPPQRQGL